MEYSFELEFYKRRTAWLEGGRVGPDPMTLWECKHQDTGSWIETGDIPKFSERFAYRWKRTTIRLTVNGRVYDLPKPETEAPGKGENFYLMDSIGVVGESTWQGYTHQNNAVSNGRIFLTREDAQAWADFERDCRLVRV